MVSKKYRRKKYCNSNRVSDPSGYLTLEFIWIFFVKKNRENLSRNNNTAENLSLIIFLSVREKNYLLLVTICDLLNGSCVFKGVIMSVCEIKMFFLIFLIDDKIFDYNTQNICSQLNHMNS